MDDKRCVRLKELRVFVDGSVLMGGMHMSSFAEITRDQVRADLAAAARSGDLAAYGEIGLKVNEQFPQLYPTRQAPPTKTREQVGAELAAAKRSGDLVVYGEQGPKQRELDSSAYPAQESQAVQIRDAVRADHLRETMRTGDFMASGEVTAQCKELHSKMCMTS